MLKYQMPWPTGGTVDVYLASDAESAIREANNYWSTFWEKECTARVAEARKQGAEEERAAILAICEKWRREWQDVDDEQVARIYSYVIERIKARGAAEPVCRCGYGVVPPGPAHSPSCPCYKPTEPAPLDKLGSLFAPDDNEERMRDAINALIEHVTRIEARGRV